MAAKTVITPAKDLDHARLDRAALIQHAQASAKLYEAATADGQRKLAREIAADIALAKRAILFRDAEIRAFETQAPPPIAVPDEKPVRGDPEEIVSVVPLDARPEEVELVAIQLRRDARAIQLDTIRQALDGWRRNPDPPGLGPELAREVAAISTILATEEKRLARARRWASIARAESEAEKQAGGRTRRMMRWTAAAVPLFADGYSASQVARRLNVSLTQAQRWSKDPKMRQRVEEHRERGIRQIQSMGLRNTVYGLVRANAIIRNPDSRDSDAIAATKLSADVAGIPKSIEVSGPDHGPVQVTVTTEDVAAGLRALGAVVVADDLCDEDDAGDFGDGEGEE